MFPYTEKYTESEFYIQNNNLLYKLHQQCQTMLKQRVLFSKTFEHSELKKSSISIFSLYSYFILYVVFVYLVYLCAHRRQDSSIQFNSIQCNRVINSIQFNLSQSLVRHPHGAHSPRLSVSTSWVDSMIRLD